MKNKYLRFKTSKLLKPFVAFYFFIGFVEIIAELFKDYFFISASKPLLIPILIAIYWLSSKSRNPIFIIALLAVWMANILLISNSMTCFMVGTFFFLIYRILIIYLVLKTIKFPGYIPMVIGALPFLFMYLFVANLSHNELGYRFYMFIIQGMFMIFFGSLCLGNYIIKSNTSNTYLLISTMLFTVIQFVLVIKMFYADYNIFQPLAMLMYVFGQYLLYLFVLIEEKKRKRYQIINKLGLKA
ncbi:lysoplasmalogenase family protein [Flavobacterium sp.]|uniref:lysoplasmalogenase family protein n=1 Tax=Flavobacterium sp. TaxID=239 RepID=UPI002635666E|nr:lysoplasmalogenase family protein [Flavobacterium sp.]